MSRTRGIIAGLLVLGSMAFGAQVNICGSGASGSGSVSFTTALTNADTYLCGDKIFSNFSGTAAAGGTISFQKFTDTLYKVTYTAPTQLALFDLGFRIAVNTATNPNSFINQITDQMFTQKSTMNGNTPNASTADIMHSPGGMVHLDSSDSGVNETSSVNMATQLELISAHYDGNGAPANGVAGRLSTLEFGISQTSVPEPMTFSFMGAGLLALGLSRRRRTLQA